MDSERESYIQLLEFTPGMRRRVEKAIAGLVELLDALEPDVDLEEDNPAEPIGDDEATLGWPAAMSQVRLGDNCDDGDLTAPERHGMGLVRCGPDGFEPEAGYDLGCASEHDGTEYGGDPEPYLSVVEWYGLGDNWTLSGNATSGFGTDVELVNEDGGDEHWERVHA